jgi:hypothetical protein
MADQRYEKRKPPGRGMTKLVANKEPCSDKHWNRRIPKGTKVGKGFCISKIMSKPITKHA